MSYVRHLFTSEGLNQTLRKSEPQMTCHPQKIHKEGVLRLLGTVNYLDKFIEHKADLLTAYPKDVAFVGEKPQHEAFDNLKSIITSVPALAYFDNNRETVLNVNASSKGLGAEIIQEGINQLYLGGRH